jgi:hypothetical protein
MARPPRFIGQGRGLAMAAPAGTPVSNSGMAREGDDRGGPPVGDRERREGKWVAAGPKLVGLRVEARWVGPSGSAQLDRYN